MAETDPRLPPPLNWLANRLQSVGEKLGEQFFDVLSEGNNSPTVQKQKKYYTNVIGRAFIAYFFIMIQPIFLEAYSRLIDWIVPPEVPDTTYFDLVTFVPSIPYGLYGASIVITGSLYLSGQLFDNFMVDGVNKGELLAYSHAGVALILTGYTFQIGAQFENELSPPGDQIYAVPDLVYYSLENIGYAIPYIVPIIFGGFALIVYYSEEQRKNNQQSTLTSNKWSK